jgi:hypothetical protein
VDSRSIVENGVCSMVRGAAMISSVSEHCK